MEVKPDTMWGLIWHSFNKIDGLTNHFIYENCLPVLFRTRHKAREYANKRYGYIKHRKDLRQEPHGYRMPKPRRVTLTFAKNNRTD